VLLLGYAERTDYPFLAAGIQIIQNIILFPYIAYEPKAWYNKHMRRAVLWRRMNIIVVISSCELEVRTDRSKRKFKFLGNVV